MYEYTCKKCNGIKFFVKDNGNNKGLYCSNCGAWIKWLGKDELNTFLSSQKEEVIKVETSSVVLTDREKLEYLLKLVTKYEDDYYDFAIKAMKENNMLANHIHSAEAGSFQRIRYVVEDMLGY